MSDNKLRLLIQSLGASLFDDSENPTGTVAMLFSETIRFRDKLKDETGTTLTVEDTQIALNALEKHLEGESLPDFISSEQKALTQIWIDRLTIFS